MIYDFKCGNGLCGISYEGYKKSVASDANPMCPLCGSKESVILSDVGYPTEDEEQNKSFF